MNFQIGLERVSAVWWGLWGLVGLVMLVANLYGTTPDSTALAWVGAGIMFAAYILHRITRWVVAGFFG